MNHFEDSSENPLDFNRPSHLEVTWNSQYIEAIVKPSIEHTPLLLSRNGYVQFISNSALKKNIYKLIYAYLTNKTFFVFFPMHYMENVEAKICLLIPPNRRWFYYSFICRIFGLLGRQLKCSNHESLLYLDMTTFDKYVLCRSIRLKYPDRKTTYKSPNS